MSDELTDRIQNADRAIESLRSTGGGGEPIYKHEFSRNPDGLCNMCHFPEGDEAHQEARCPACDENALCGHHYHKQHPAPPTPENAQVTQGYHRDLADKWLSDEIGEYDSDDAYWQERRASLAYTLAQFGRELENKLPCGHRRANEVGDEYGHPYCEVCAARDSAVSETTEAVRNICDGAQRDRWQAGLSAEETTKWNKWICELGDAFRSLSPDTSQKKEKP